MLFKAVTPNPKANRVLLRLALLAGLSTVVVWNYFGKGNLITDCILVLFAE
jgi:hypothetical protein